MSDLRDIMKRAGDIKREVTLLLPALPADTPQEVKTALEVIEAKLSHLHSDIGHVRSSLRPLIDG